MEGQEEDDEGGMEEVGEPAITGSGIVREEDKEISMHALQGCPMGIILKVKGLVGKKVVILNDSGSTHSFLDEETAIDL